LNRTEQNRKVEREKRRLKRTEKYREREEKRRLKRTEQ
jgi:hypothetical protein